MAHKEFVHNEALNLIDALLAGSVEEGPRDAPPADPSIGACFIVGTAPTGDWAGNANSVAAYGEGGWRLQPPVEGMRLLMRDSGLDATFRQGTWELGAARANTVLVGGEQVVGGREPAIAAPTGGQVVDAEARAVLGAILTALRNHGLIAS